MIALLKTQDREFSLVAEVRIGAQVRTGIEALVQQNLQLANILANHAEAQVPVKWVRAWQRCGDRSEGVGG